MSFRIALIKFGSKEFDQFTKWRNSYLGDNPANEKDFNLWDKIRDECSYNFGFFKDDKIIGGVRMTPVGHGLTLGERVLSLSEWETNIRVGTTLEVNRLVIDTSLRGSGAVRTALLECFQWIRNNTNHFKLIAFCSERLVPLYIRIGATLERSDISSPMILGKKYSLMTLNLGE
ncbi:GNAT family N-acetyltransferase [Acinetobacter baumannii]|uniref:GNAT family N-acetyltransferase n=1 Tax=Acinetobacter baumannii TaxID=470 RepID=UPI001C0C0EF1|nr:GNAT family N-acetyltransferase [Acinetobacter baumannii]MBU3082493.1 GNAT family N-acetyltransferase [Acinetobacter baumannii]MDC4652074.1 GNAT family N-acetyltransferase [Acinetobacter baumannii]MDC5116123.1 GNAT family N-acetyltransferase [Acinetobacter baumannii]MDC5449586.1 GNAT family N-acetyltransferase [Acinetobacter baumannii]